MIQAPIWKDTYYVKYDLDGTGLAPLEYFVMMELTDASGRVARVEIFHGKAYQQPDTDRISININSICKDYLDNVIPEQSEERPADAYHRFELQDSLGNVLETYGFLYDWSYDNSDFTSDILMSHPINGHYDSRMNTLMTYWESTDKSVRNYNRRGLTFDDEPLYPVLSCGEYALHYLNTAGGWDSLLIEGAVAVRDTYSRLDITNNFNNNLPEFSKRHYQNNITKQYTLNSGWLTTEQGDRLVKYLLPSRKVYLERLSDKQLIPVVITNSSADYKTTRKDKVINYAITVQESQLKTIR